MEDSANETGESLAPAEWKNPPNLLDLKKDLTEANSAHNAQVAKIDNWVDNLKVQGKAKPTKVVGKSAIQPKLIRKNAEWRYAALSEPFLSTENMFKCAPVTWEDVQSAQQNQLVLNNQINTKIKKVRFVDRYVRSIVDKGTAIVRVGWDFQEEEVEETNPVVEFRPNPQLAPMHQELAKMKEENPTGYKFDVPEELKQAHEMSMQSGQSLEPIITGTTTATVMKTTVNQPTLDVCNYKNIIIDPSCEGDFEKAKFIIFSFETSKSDLKKKGRYQDLDKINVAGNTSVLSEPDHSSTNDSDFNFSDDARKKFVAHEYWGYWDFDNSGIAKPFVATWVGETMIRMEENPYPDKGLPFVIVPFMPVDDSVHGEPDGELLEDNQKVVGAVTRGMMDTLGRSANGQVGYRKDALDAVNKRKFQNGKDYEYNGGVDPRMAFHMHTYPEIPQSAQFVLQQQSLEAESMSGVKAFSQGIDGDALGESVGNGRSVLDAASKREAGILRRLEEGMVEIGRKIISMNSEFLDEEEVVRITNEDFATVRRDDLAGKYDLTLAISTAEEDNEKAGRLEFMMQTLGNTVDWGVTKLVLRDIARLRKMPELAHAIEEFQPEPDPQQQAIQELEVQKLQAEIAEIQSRTQENFSDAGLNQAKAGTEQAKARQLGSDADLKDLDFVETESGVKQERDKELAGAQAEGNIELEKVKQGGARESELNQYLSGKNSSEK